MNKKTKAAHERYLNALYTDMYSESQAIDNFIYLTVKSRGKHTTVKGIKSAFANHTLGTLLRKYDPIAFNVSHSESK